MHTRSKKFFIWYLMGNAPLGPEAEVAPLVSPSPFFVLLILRVGYSETNKKENKDIIKN